MRNSNYDFNFEKQKARQQKSEEKAGGFRCSHCKIWVGFDPFMGTNNRNHCNVCLWSKHVDNKPGDRRETCHGGMEPIGLTFKHEGFGKQGEIMLIHHCRGCQKISINRIARDDLESEIVNVFENSLNESTKLDQDIYVLSANDRDELNRQLFGN